MNKKMASAGQYKQKNQLHPELKCLPKHIKSQSSGMSELEKNCKMQVQRSSLHVWNIEEQEIPNQ